MLANTRARTPLRAALNVENLEGRAVPAAGFGLPVLAGPCLAAPLPADANAVGVSQAALSAPSQGHSAVRVVSQIFVNGDLMLKVKGKPQFAAIGPALSMDENGNQIESGGTSVFVTGTAVGTFDGHPTITRDNPMFVHNKHGQTVKVVTYHITGTPYLAPPTTAANWHDVIGGVWVG